MRVHAAGIALERREDMVIVYATDLTGDDDAAFAHAAAIAVACKAQLISLHAGPLGEVTPDAARLATRWGHPIAHEFRRLESDDDDADTIIEAVRALRPSLVVLGTHARHGLAALLRGSVGEAIARNLDVPTLLVPNGTRGFVDPETGEVRLEKILIPAGTAAEAIHSTEAARAITALLGTEPPTLHVVHVGPIDRELAELGGTRLEGPLADAIVDFADRREVELIVMTTRGHDGVGDVLSGSRTEHVIRYARRPVLAVPWSGPTSKDLS
jgi:nucleotide-binding universal stress UspA family protein